MGLQEGRRVQLLPDELTDLEKQRQDERLFEKKMTLKRQYGRSCNVLLLVAFLTLATVLLFPRRYKLTFPLASQISQLCMAYGYQGHMAVGFGLATLVGLILLGLWWLSRRHYGWMIGAAVFTLLDCSGSVFMLNLMNQEVNRYNETAGMDVAAGVPGAGGNAYDFMTIFFITVFVHVVVIVYLVYGAVKGAQMRRVPDTGIEEKKVEKARYFDGKDYTEHPEEGRVPLRPIDPAATRLLKAEVQGMQVEVLRSFGVTALAVDGQVYNDQKGKVEPLYHLRALVNGVHLDVENRPMTGYTVMTLTADGEEIERRNRYL